MDAHVHVNLKAHCGSVSAERLSKNWAMEVGIHQSWEELHDSYDVLFPGHSVSSLVFGGVYREIDSNADNDYVLAGAQLLGSRTKALMVTRPEYPAARVADGLANGFCGIKPYPDFAPQGMDDASIFDVLPPEHLAVLDQSRGVLMLHLPRRGRLADADNVREVLQIADSYPSVRLILAHVGRAYCLPNAVAGLRNFRNVPQVMFDTSANLNSDVFLHVLETVGPDRLLFGSDLPITMMRGKREHIGDECVSYTSGEYSWDTDRRTPEEEAGYTFFVCESLRALISAVSRSGMGHDVVNRIMFGNASDLLGLDADRSDPGAVDAITTEVEMRPITR